MSEMLGVMAGLATVAVWAWWKHKQNKKGHAELMRRMAEMAEGWGANEES